MQRYIVPLLILLLATSAWADATKLAPSECGIKEITSTTTDDFYVVAGGRLLDVQADDDTSGVGGGFSVDVYTCDEADYPTSCKLYTEGTFLGTLDGASADMRGVQEIGVAGYLYFDITAVGSGSPAIKVCAR